jgi:hypothetical protein
VSTADMEVQLSDDRDDRYSETHAQEMEHNDTE